MMDRLHTASTAGRALVALIMIATVAGCSRAQPAVKSEPTAGTLPPCNEAGAAARVQPVAPAPAPVVPAPAPSAPAPAASKDQEGAASDGTIPVDDLVGRVMAITSWTSRPKPTMWLDEAMEALARNNADIVSAAYAVAVDPMSAPARYVLACALARQGMHERAVHELEQLREAGCPACLDALQNIAGDEICGFQPEVARLLDGVARSPVRTAAETMIASFNSGDVASAEPYIDATRPATMGSDCSVCSEPTTEKSRWTRDALIKLIRGADERMEAGPYTYQRPRLLFCDDRCCSGPTGYLTHTSIFVESICFRGGRTPKLHSMSVVDGG